jgi:sulfatase modifying factor 1
VSGHQDPHVPSRLALVYHSSDMKCDQWVLRLLPLAMAGTLLAGYLRNQASLSHPPQSLPPEGAAVPADAEQDREPSVARFIRDLGCEDPDVRDRASGELRRIGKPAEEALSKALESSPDAEIRSRAGDILKTLAKAPDAVARIETETVEIPGTNLKFELVAIPGGKSTIGSPEDEKGRKADEKQRELELRPFSLGVFAVTWAEYTAFRTPLRGKPLDGITRPTMSDAFFGDLGMPVQFLELDRPVTNVRWHGAVQYCEWLSKKTGRYFRLPTEVEWEVAARARSTAAAVDLVGDQAWYKDNSDHQTHPGGLKKPNAFGLYDILGNVWAYTLEFHDAPEFSPVVRGGCWSSPAGELRFANRQTVQKEWFEEDPNRPTSLWWLTTSTVSVGFRVVCVADASDFKEREAYASKVDVRITGHREKTIKIGRSLSPWHAVTGEVRNGGDRALDELEIRVNYLNRDGSPHLKDVGGPAAGRGTFSKAWPVLANSALEGDVRIALAPGETRAFAIDIPYSFDLEDDGEPKIAFAGVVTALRFSK